MLVSSGERPSSKTSCPVYICWSVLAAILIRDFLLGNRKNPGSHGSSTDERQRAQETVKGFFFFGQEESFLPGSGWGSLPQPKSPVWWVLCIFNISRGASHIKEDFPKHSDESKLSSGAPSEQAMCLERSHWCRRPRLQLAKLAQAVNEAACCWRGARRKEQGRGLGSSHSSWDIFEDWFKSSWASSVPLHPCCL